jgi:hypothetical protein
MSSNLDPNKMKEIQLRSLQNNMFQEQQATLEKQYVLRKRMLTNYKENLKRVKENEKRKPFLDQSQVLAPPIFEKSREGPVPDNNHYSNSVEQVSKKQKITLVPPTIPGARVDPRLAARQQKKIEEVQKQKVEDHVSYFFRKSIVLKNTLCKHKSRFFCAFIRIKFLNHNDHVIFLSVKTMKYHSSFPGIRHKTAFK